MIPLDELRKIIGPDAPESDDELARLRDLLATQAGLLIDLYRAERRKQKELSNPGPPVES